VAGSQGLLRRGRGRERDGRGGRGYRGRGRGRGSGNYFAASAQPVAGQGSASTAEDAAKARLRRAHPGCLLRCGFTCNFSPASCAAGLSVTGATPQTGQPTAHSTSPTPYSATCSLSWPRPGEGGLRPCRQHTLGPGGQPERSAARARTGRRTTMRWRPRWASRCSPTARSAWAGS
jgi:hypothetical protein